MRYFRQKKGVPMGGNTSNIYADMYMSYRISLIRSKLKGLGVFLIRKYVDDFLLYLPRANIKRVLKLLEQGTRLAYTVECPNAKGELAYLDLLIVDFGQKLTTRWYRKEICSERSVNYFSNVPQYEFLNTFMMRFVVAGLHDSGGSFLRSFWVILREAWYNSIPKRFIQLSLRKASHYYLGRCGAHKQLWLEFLAKEIYAIDLRVVLYEHFVDHVEMLAVKYGIYDSLFNFKDERVCIIHPKFEKRSFWVPGEPIHVFTYRGRQSMALYDTVKECYPGFPVSIRHNVSFNGKSLVCNNGKRRRLNYAGKG